MYNNDPEAHSDLVNERILSMIDQPTSEAVSSDPEVKAAFEESLRHLAEDILEYNPGLAHILIAMSDDPLDSVHGQN